MNEPVGATIDIVRENIDQKILTKDNWQVASSPISEIYLRKRKNDYDLISITIEPQRKVIDVKIGQASDPKAIKLSDMINLSNPIEFLDLIFNKGYIKKSYLYEGKLYKTVFLDPESGNIIGRRIEPHSTLKFLLSVWFHTSAEWGAVINSSVTLKEEKFSFD